MRIAECGKNIRYTCDADGCQKILETGVYPYTDAATVFHKAGWVAYVPGAKPGERLVNPQYHHSCPECYADHCKRHGAMPKSSPNAA